MDGFWNVDDPGANTTGAWTTFTVNNSTVEATDTVVVDFRSSTDILIGVVSKVSAGSFAVSFISIGGTTTEQPVVGFAVIKAVTS